MPAHDGFELCRNINEPSKKIIDPKTPVIAINAISSSGPFNIPKNDVANSVKKINQLIEKKTPFFLLNSFGGGFSVN